MKKCSTLKLLLAIICLFLSVSSQAQETSPVTVRVETAGTLSTLIPAKDKYLITDLTLSGNLNGTDILYIREMAGGGLWKDSKTEGKLKKLDLSNADIVSGGDAYYQYYYEYYEDSISDIGNKKLEYSQTFDNHISKYMFYNLSSLTSIILPQNITSIEEFAFTECLGLTSLTIPGKVIDLGTQAFYNCNGLKSISISNSVTYIGAVAFGNCTGLSSITIPLSLKSYYSDAFDGCTGLKEFIVLENDTKFSTVEGVLFNKDKTEIIAYPNAKSSTYIIPSTVTSIGDNAFAGCSSLTSVTIPNSVKEVGSDAFTFCDSLTSISIPASVTDLGIENSFYGCIALKKFIVSDENPNYKAVDGVLFDKNGTLIIAYPNAKSSEYIIPDGVKAIAPLAFSCCLNLESVTIPNSVRTIYYYAFMTSINLTTINIGNSVTTIDGGAFFYCTGLKSINIPNSVKDIDILAFANCSSLAFVSIGNSIASIGDCAFLRCSALKEIHCRNSVPTVFPIDSDTGVHSDAFVNVDKTTCKLYVPKGSYSAYKNAEVWNEFNIILEEESTAISEVETNNISVYTELGNVVVKNAEPGKIVSVYNTLGALLQTVKVTDNELRITLPINQIYFIRIADKRYKVAL